MGALRAEIEEGGQSLRRIRPMRNLGTKTGAN
jgi:hypothetical protein